MLYSHPRENFTPEKNWVYMVYVNNCKIHAEKSEYITGQDRISIKLWQLGNNSRH